MSSHDRLWEVILKEFDEKQIPGTQLIGVVGGCLEGQFSSPYQKLCTEMARSNTCRKTEIYDLEHQISGYFFLQYYRHGQLRADSYNCEAKTEAENHSLPACSGTVLCWATHTQIGENDSVALVIPTATSAIEACRCDYKQLCGSGLGAVHRYISLWGNGVSRNLAWLWLCPTTIVFHVGTPDEGLESKMSSSSLDVA